jgi:hypothetical protein
MVGRDAPVERPRQGARRQRAAQGGTEDDPWVDVSKIRVGSIDPEQRKAIDAQLVRLIAAHWRGTNVPGAHRERPCLVLGAVTEPKRKGKCNPEHAERLREYNRRRSEAIRARKEAANGPDQIEVRFLEAYAAGTAVTERVAAT